MYEIIRRSQERPWHHRVDQINEMPSFGLTSCNDIVVQMRQNRSHFPQEGRAALSMMLALLMLTSVVPAIKGYWLVPVFSLGVMGSLVLALEFHQKSAPMSETLEFSGGQLRYTSSSGERFEQSSFWVRLDTIQRHPLELRLFLNNRNDRIEFGSTLSLDERRALAPFISAALAQSRGL